MTELRRILVRRAVAVVLLLGLTMLRLLTDLGLKPAVATELYLLAVTGIVLFWCYRVLVGLPTPEAFWSRAARRPNLRGRPERLEVLEESVAYWVRTDYTRYRRLRPAVRALVEPRLRRAGIDIDHDPRAPQLLGSAVWELVREDAPAPTDDDTGSMTGAETDQIARTLTALGRVDFTRAGQTGEQH